MDISKKDMLLQIMSESMKIDISKLNLDGSIFDAGGDSLGVMNFIMTIHDRFKIDLNLDEIYEASTINEILNRCLTTDSSSSQEIFEV